MKIRKSLAGVAAGSLALAGLAVAGAPSAFAGTSGTTPAATTWYSQINDSSLQATGTSWAGRTVSLTTSVTSGTVGSGLNVSVSGDISFYTGSVAASPAGSQRIDALLEINGARYLITGPSNSITAAKNTSCTAGLQPCANLPASNIIKGPWTISSTAGASNGINGDGSPANTGGGWATVSATGVVTPGVGALTIPGPAGSASIKLIAVINNSNSGTASSTPDINNQFDEYWSAVDTTPSLQNYVDTGVPTGPLSFPTAASAQQPLTVIGPNATVATSTGQAAGAQAIGRNSSAFLPLARTITLSGAQWDANVASGGFAAQVCDQTGAACDAAVVTSTVTTDGTGAINGGSLTIPGGAAGTLTTGNRAIKLTQGTNSALVNVVVLGTPTITVTPASGGVNTTAQVSGSNFNVGVPVTIYGSTATAGNVRNDDTSDPQVTTIATDANGAFPNTGYLIQAANTGSLVAAQGLPILGAPTMAQASAFGAFTLSLDECTGPCSLTQNVSATVTGGALKMKQAGSSIVLPAVATSTTATPASAAFNALTVTDLRGGTAGWSITAQMSDLTGVGGGTIQAQQFNLSGLTYTETGTTLGTKNTSTGALNTAQTVCGAPATNTLTGSTQGEFGIAGTLNVSVPAYQRATSYSGVLTFTIA